MSIFRRKGTIEGLFRIGAEEHLNTDAVAETPTRRGVKHEVYYVRGRPFIAPAQQIGAPRLRRGDEPAHRTRPPCRLQAGRTRFTACSFLHPLRIPSFAPKHVAPLTTLCATSLPPSKGRPTSRRSPSPPPQLPSPPALFSKSPPPSPPPAALPPPSSHLPPPLLFPPPPPAALALRILVAQPPADAPAPSSRLAAPVLAPAPKPRVQPAFLGGPPMPHNRSVSPRREPRELAGRMGASRGALSSAKAVMAEEEMAALFRNNLLRSCWKPGLSAEAVQHVLTIWEIKLVEVLHRWVHPEKWEGLKRWKRMWRLRSGRLRDMVRLTAPSTLPRPPALPPSYPPSAPPSPPAPPLLPSSAHLLRLLLSPFPPSPLLPVSLPSPPAPPHTTLIAPSHSPHMPHAAPCPPGHHRSPPPPAARRRCPPLPAARRRRRSLAARPLLPSLSLSSPTPLPGRASQFQRAFGMKDRKKRRALTVWQKRTTHIPAHFKNRARRKFLLWKRTALLMRSLACCRLKQPFAQWRRRAELRKSRQGTMINALGALRNPGLKHAFNTWWFKVRPKPHTHSRAFTTQPAAALPGSARSGRVSLPTCRALSSFTSPPAFPAR